ncbi:MAG: tetratricopeptide repeat protein [Planctomycetes bacterium]|nr:tetratricopeptide repeat protein [Planctomycetota bacterium]
MSLDKVVYTDYSSSLIKIGQLDEAIDILKKGVAYHSDSAQLYYNLALAYAQKQDIKNALTNGLKSYELNPKNGDLCFLIGHAFFSEKNYTDSSKYNEEALKSNVNPQYQATLFYELAFCYFTLNEYDNSIKYVKYLLKLIPDHLIGHQILLESLNIKGKHKEVIGIATKAISKMVDSLTIRYNLGLAYFREGRYEDAVGQIKVAIQYSKGDHSMYLHRALGDSYAMLAKYNDAIFAYQKAVESGENSPELWSNLACCYKSLNDYKNAIKALKKSISIKSEPQVHLSLGQLYVDAGKKKSALKQYEILKNLDAEKAQILRANIDSRFPQSHKVSDSIK